MAFIFVNNNDLVDTDKIEAVTQTRNVVFGTTLIEAVIGENKYKVDMSIEELITMLKQPDLSKQITQV